MKNNKGFINITYIFVMMMVVVALAMAQQGDKMDQVKNEETLKNVLNWTNIGNNVSISIQRSANNPENPEYLRVLFNMVDKAVDFFGYSIFEVTKLAVSITFDNPDIINYKVLFSLIILSLIAPLIYPIFMVVISLILIIKEWYANRKEKIKK